MHTRRQTASWRTYAVGREAERPERRVRGYIRCGSRGVGSPVRPTAARAWLRTFLCDACHFGLRWIAPTLRCRAHVETFVRYGFSSSISATEPSAGLVYWTVV